MSEQPNANDDADSSPEGDPSPRELRLQRTFQFRKQLPADILPPEALERLRAGGHLTPAELARIRAAAVEGSGPLGRFIESVTSHADPSSVVESPDLESLGASLDAEQVIVPGSARSYKWEWRSERVRESIEPGPATYYEAITGQRDPARDLFITARRVLDAIVWVIVLGLPLLVVTLTVATGQSAQTVVVAGVAAFVVGMMFRYSVPRTPFG